MADEHDYTSMWSGTFSPPDVGGGGGVYLLDDEASVGRAPGGGAFGDRCTRALYEDAHPRTYPGGQRYPGPFGAGRASDRVGPGFAERDADARRASARFAGEGFRGGGPDGPDAFDGPGRGPDADERARYVRGSRALGHPGPRGMVTSARGARQAVDDVVWDNRPLHYADGTGNEFAHLFIDPAARGPPLYRRDLTFPGFGQVDHFGNRAAGGMGEAQVIKVVLFFIVVVLAATWLMIAGAEKRVGREVRRALREAAGLRAPAPA